MGYFPLNKLISLKYILTTSVPSKFRSLFVCIRLKKWVRFVMCHHGTMTLFRTLHISPFWLICEQTLKIELYTVNVFYWYKQWYPKIQKKLFSTDFKLRFSPYFHLELRIKMSCACLPSFPIHNQWPGKVYHYCVYSGVRAPLHKTSYKTLVS